MGVFFNEEFLQLGMKDFASDFRQTPESSFLKSNVHYSSHGVTVRPRDRARSMLRCRAVDLADCAFCLTSSEGF